MTSLVTSSVTTSGQVSCPICGLLFTRVRRQAYCTPACRQAAWRARQPDPAVTVRARTPAPPAGSRRERTVYECADCGERYLGVQWCPDCQRPCVRIGHGGQCRECGQTITVDELLDLDDDRHTTSKIR